MTNLLGKIQTLRNSIAKANVKKSGYNSFSKARYYELSDFMGLVRKASTNLKIFTKYDVLDGVASLTVYDLESDANIKFTIPFKASTNITDEAQANGSGLTYARRYIYVNFLELVEDDELDGTDYVSKNKNKGTSKRTQPQSTGNYGRTVQTPETSNNRIAPDNFNDADKTNDENDYWDGQSRPERFQLFTRNGIEYKVMTKKADGTLFGLATNDDTPYEDKFFNLDEFN